MSSPFETLVADALDRIERKCDTFHTALTSHTENDREQFSELTSTVDTLATDYAIRQRQAEDAGHAAGAKAGKFWAIIGTILAALVSGIGAAAK